jgi:hypothetical protein
MRVSLLVILALATLCPACSSDRKPVHKVRGQVLVDGRPAAQAQVLLHPAGNDAEELRPAGQTDEQGNFQLTSYVNGDGAPAGDYAVTVTWFRIYQGRDEVMRYNALPQRYAAAQTSQLRVTVGNGDNALSPLQLSSR